MRRSIHNKASHQAGNSFYEPEYLNTGDVELCESQIYFLGKMVKSYVEIMLSQVPSGCG